jgi:sulfite reductase (NADPH) hemoprotein beta-component
VTELSTVEKIKRESRRLRGQLADSLVDPRHGFDPRGRHGADQVPRHVPAGRSRRARGTAPQKLEPAYMFMIRTRLPGGVCSSQQWLQLDEIARRYGNGTLRITTRQAFQFHGVIKDRAQGDDAGNQRRP